MAMLLLVNKIKARSYVTSAAIAFAFLLAIFVEPMRVSSVSMANTYCDGDIVLVERMHGPSLTLPETRRGNVVVLRALGEADKAGGPDAMLIKRIIGVGGDRIRIVRGVVFVNGTPVAEPYVRHKAPYRAATDSWPEDVTGSGQRDVIVPEDSLFVMGDNREQSSDSRSWGPVRRQDVAGYVLFRLPSLAGHTASCQL
jgi:signal peptidase I